MLTTTLTPPQKRRIRKLVEALRSGKYKQAKGQLRDGDKFCCLGVACDLYGKAHKIEWEGPYFLGEEAILPFDVREWYGFIEGNPVVIEYDDHGVAFANDSGRRFPTIARLFEKTYLPDEAKKKKGK